MAIRPIRAKFGVTKQFEKVMLCMLSGDAITLDEIDRQVGTEIEMYRISSYILNIKMFTPGVTRPIKNGRKVIGYQLANPAECIKYCESRGILPKVETLTDLNAQSVPTEPVEDYSIVSETA